MRRACDCVSRAIVQGVLHCTRNNRTRGTFSTKQSTGSNYHTRWTRVKKKMHRAHNREIDGRLSCWGTRVQQNRPLKNWSFYLSAN